MSGSRRDQQEGRCGFGECVVIGGNGAVGRLFTLHLARSAGIVTVIDPAPLPDRLLAEVPVSGIRHLACDATAPDATVVAAIGRADLVVLAVPEAAALAAVPALRPHLPTAALLVESLSVKSRIRDALEREVPDLAAVGVNPMFAPSLGLSGRPVAAVTYRDGAPVRPFLALLTSWGARVVPVPVAEHDRLTAALQAATHAAVLAFGQALRDLAVDVTILRALAPPPHLTLLALLARILSAAPEVYWDIQHGNPGARTARQLLIRGVDQIDASAAAADSEAFRALLADLADYLGDHRADLADLCVRLFAAVPVPASHGPDDE